MSFLATYYTEYVVLRLEVPLRVLATPALVRRSAGYPRYNLGTFVFLRHLNSLSYTHNFTTPSQKTTLVLSIILEEDVLMFYFVAFKLICTVFICVVTSIKRFHVALTLTRLRPDLISTLW